MGFWALLAGPGKKNQAAADALGGDAGAFIAEGNTSPGGILPMNTNGGGLSYTHTGMYGMFAIQESV